MRAPSARERGAGLVIALLTLAVTGILAAAVSSAMRTLLRDSLYQERLLQAQAIAESGAEEALARLSRDGAWREGFGKKGFLEGYFEVVLSSGPAPTVTATGYSKPLALFGRARRRVSFKARVVPLPRLLYGVAAGDTLFFIAGQSLVDSYDSEADPDPREFGKNGNALTNRNLVIAGKGTAVYGNAAYRTGSEPPLGAVSGQVLKSQQDLALPPEDGSAYVGENDNQAGLQPSFIYDPARRRLLVPWNAVATIRSGVYHFNEMRIDGTLRAKPVEGPVVIYLSGGLNLTGNLENPSKIPANLVIYGQGSNIAWTLAGQRPLYAALYAPTTDVILSQSLYGALAGRKVSFLRGALHYDSSLGGPRAYAVRVAPKSWGSR